MPELPHKLCLSDTVFCGVWQGLQTLTPTGYISEPGEGKPWWHLWAQEMYILTLQGEDNIVLPP